MGRPLLVFRPYNCAVDSREKQTHAAGQHRPIRSFVLRQGRVSPGQQRAHEALMPRFGAAYAPAILDLTALFERCAPTFLEIGFGMGETTAAMALAQSQHNFLCIEVHTPGVGSLLRQIEERHLANIRIIQHDAVEVLRHMIAPAALNGVHIFFPDPWPKKRHHKRRLVQPDFVALLAEKLKPGAYVHCATDWQEYAEQMLAVLEAGAGLKNSAGGFAPRPAYRPLTKFEKRGLNLGHGVWDIIFVKR
jgi:tRNA (guanine-N7-)-methyltransferase